MASVLLITAPGLPSGLTCRAHESRTSPAIGFPCIGAKLQAVIEPLAKTQLRCAIDKHRHVNIGFFAGELEAAVR